MRKLENYTGEQARAYKKFAQKAQGSRADFEADLNFNEAPSKFVKSNESKQTLKSIKDQIDYFGYEIEPFNMKNERDVGKFDDGGYFVFDKAKDKSVKYKSFFISDAWLDQLDQSNMFQELQEKAQAENSKKIQKQLKEANKNYERRMQKLRGDGFFSSTKFGSKAEAEEFYQIKKQENHEEQQEVEVEANQQVEEKSKEQQQNQSDEQEVKLELLQIEQLKEILYELLEENENANQAMKRVRSKLASNQKKVFKKNVRKDNTEHNDKQDQKPQENNNEAKDEAKQTLDILVDICTIIVKKSNDPSIYTIKKEELVPKKVSRLEEDDIF